MERSMKFSTLFECGPYVALYIHLTPDKCSHAFPVFHCPSTSVYYMLNTNQRTKNGGGL